MVRPFGFNVFVLALLCFSSVYAHEKLPAQSGDYCDNRNTGTTGCQRSYNEGIGTGAVCSREVADRNPDDYICVQYTEGVINHEEIIWCSPDSRSPWRLEYQSGDPNSNYSYVCTNEAEPEPECAIPAGQSAAVFSSLPLGSSGCYENCEVSYLFSGSMMAGGQESYMYDATSNGNTCTPGSGSPAPAAPYADENGCYQGTDGGSWCPTPSGDCPNEFSAGGVRYCKYPGEDGGDDGGGDDGQDPGEGDGGECDPETEDCSGDDGGDGGDGGDQGGDNGGGGGSGDDEGQDDCDADACEPMPDLPGPQACTTADQCLSNAFTRLQAAPIIASIANVPQMIAGSGSCPVISIDLSSVRWGVITSDVMCQIGDRISGPLSTAMLAVWIIVGIRIFASA